MVIGRAMTIQGMSLHDAPDLQLNAPHVHTWQELAFLPALALLLKI